MRCRTLWVVYIVGGYISKYGGETGNDWEDGGGGASWYNTKYSEEEESTSGRGMMIGRDPDVKV